MMLRAGHGRPGNEVGPRDKVGPGNDVINKQSISNRKKLILIMSIG